MYMIQLLFITTIKSMRYVWASAQESLSSGLHLGTVQTSLFSYRD